MKKTLKLASVVLALAFVVSMLAITAFADTTYSITVNTPDADVDAGEVYNAWQVLSIETFTTATGTGELATATYKVATDWEDFFTTGAGKDYFDVDGSNYVSVKEGVTLTDDSDAMKALAKAAVAYAKDNSLAATSTATLAEDATSVTLSVPGAGWYAVDSTVGSICMIDNAYPNATINDKNDVPTVTKTVEGAETTTASVGDTVDYSVTVSLVPGQTKAVFHDVMETGLAYDSTTLKIQVGDPLADLDSTYYDLTVADGDTLTVTFTAAYLASLTADTDVIITYSADITAAAIADANGLTNAAKLDYGNSSTTETDVATVYTYGFDLAKYDGNTKKVIDGATFSLWTDETAGTEIALYYDSANGYYRPAVDAETASDIAVGIAKVEGLADGIYYLQEENFPAGYNKLASRVAVTIDGADVFFTANAPTAVGSDISSTEGGVLIENKQGNVLPTTGGMGTTILYIAGAILVIGAGVVLVSKKRMGAAK